MIVVDKALEKLEAENMPIRIGLVGAGFAARGFMVQMLSAIKGMRLVAVSNRTKSYAVQGFEEAEYTNFKKTKNLQDLEKTISMGKTALTNDPFLLTDSKQVDVIVEATGEVEFGSQVILRAIENNKSCDIDGFPISHPCLLILTYKSTTKTQPTNEPIKLNQH